MVKEVEISTYNELEIEGPKLQKQGNIEKVENLTTINKVAVDGIKDEAWWFDDERREGSPSAIW